MRSLLWVLSALILATRIASAQAIDEPEISVGGFEVAANGAERAAGIWRTTGPLIMGKPTVGVFSTLGCGYFTVTVPPKPFEEKATAGWRVEVTPIKIDFPKGTIALNAVPWAEVWVDGTKIGDTPIGNLSLVIGPHEIVFRHPDLGEQRHAATVTLNSPARLSVDLRKK